MPHVLVTEIKIGDKIDLLNDPYISIESEPLIEFEYGEVSGIEIETPECIRLDFININSIGFPINHKLFVGNRA